MSEKVSTLLENINYLVTIGKVPIEAFNWAEIQAGRPITVNELLLVEYYSGWKVDQLLHKNIGKLSQVKLENIKMLVLDVDGVMTDGGMIFTKTGDEIKKFNSKDGMAIGICHEKNILVGIISAGHHGAIVEKRANMLGIDRFYVGKRPKLDILKAWLNDLQLQPEQIAYIGDDINDLPIMEFVGVSACPGDAALAVKNAATVLLTINGGKGCVREFVDEYLIKVQV